mmetsp:Transcript_15759/g.23193  ORF Transcript_15759/g.23193 Transcript_15759/m.23193 type:complete len:211 (-) Transcript_15759:529-1161(-)
MPPYFVFAAQITLREGKRKAKEKFVNNTVWVWFVQVQTAGQIEDGKLYWTKKRSWIFSHGKYLLLISSLIPFKVQGTSLFFYHVGTVMDESSHVFGSVISISTNKDIRNLQLDMFFRSSESKVPTMYCSHYHDGMCRIFIRPEFSTLHGIHYLTVSIFNHLSRMLGSTVCWIFGTDIGPKLDHDAMEFPAIIEVFIKGVLETLAFEVIEA